MSEESMELIREFLRQFGVKSQVRREPAQPGNGSCGALQREIQARLRPMHRNWAADVRTFPSPVDWAADVMSRARAAGLLDGYTLEAIFSARADYEFMAAGALAEADRRRATRAARQARKAAES